MAQDDQLYLRGNVMLEPLFNRWYAWSYLLSPMTAPMYVANLHLQLMESFIAAPQVHVAALKQPKNLGGPFINYEASRVSEIRALLETTIKENQQQIAFAAGVKELDRLLHEEAGGLTLEPLYQRVPDALKGYVELTYDLNQQTSIRFMEAMLYRSPYYNTASQSFTLGVTDNDERPFVFSTPRLGGDGLAFNLPFNSPAIDKLFRMKERRNSVASVGEMLGINKDSETQFSTFFTNEPPPARPPFTEDGVRIRYFGHACVLVESAHTSVLCDPVISYPSQNGLPRFSFPDLPERIDYVVLTHNHQDHCMFETLLQLRHKIGTVVVPRNCSGNLADPSLKLILQHAGFPSVIEIDELETIPVDGGGIIGLPFLGEHGDLNIHTKIAYAIKLAGRTILFVADSNNIEPRVYSHLKDVVGEVDILFVGMECEGAPLSWLYGPLLTKPMARKADQSRRLDGSNFEKAFDIVERLRPNQVYVYAMGQEPWLTYLTSIQYTPASRPIVESDKLVSECLNRKIPCERLYGQKEIHLNKQQSITGAALASLKAVDRFVEIAFVLTSSQLIS